jgi:hypothetical protein
MRTRSYVLLLTGLVLAIVATFPSPAQAQAVVVGAKVGVNVANVDITASDLTVTPKRRNGAVAGVFLGTDPTKPFGLQVEGLYSQKGTKIVDPEDTATLDFRVDYFEVPVLARVSLKGANGVYVHLLAGPSFAAKIKDVQKLNDQDLDTEDKLPLKKADIGFLFGGALEVHRFIVEARYTLGLTNIDDSGETDVTVKTRTFAVLVGVRFN